jgi:hypothetical protein
VSEAAPARILRFLWKGSQARAVLHGFCTGAARGLHGRAHFIFRWGTILGKSKEKRHVCGRTGREYCVKPATNSPEAGQVGETVPRKRLVDIRQKFG